MCIDKNEVSSSPQEAQVFTIKQTLSTKGEAGRFHTKAIFPLAIKCNQFIKPRYYFSFFITSIQ